MRVVCCCCSAFAVQSMLCGTQWVIERWVFEFEITVKIFGQTSVRVSYGFYWVKLVRYWDISLSEEIWVMSVGIWVSDIPNKALVSYILVVIITRLLILWLNGLISQELYIWFYLFILMKALPLVFSQSYFRGRCFLYVLSFCCNKALLILKLKIKFFLKKKWFIHNILMLVLPDYTK